MICSAPEKIGLAIGATLLCFSIVPASAAPTGIAPAKIVALDSPLIEVQYRAHAGQGARHVTVTRHSGSRSTYRGGHYYRHGNYHNDFWPAAAALGLFGGIVGAIAASSYDDDPYYGYTYPVSYGYGYPVNYGYDWGYPYDYSYAQPVYYGGYYGGYRPRARVVNRYAYTNARYVHRAAYAGHRQFVTRAGVAGPRAGVVNRGVVNRGVVNRGAVHRGAVHR